MVHNSQFYHFCSLDDIMIIDTEFQATKKFGRDMTEGDEIKLKRYSVREVGTK